MEALRQPIGATRLRDSSLTSAWVFAMLVQRSETVSNLRITPSVTHYFQSYPMATMGISARRAARGGRGQPNVW